MITFLVYSLEKVLKISNCIISNSDIHKISSQCHSEPIDYSRRFIHGGWAIREGYGKWRIREYSFTFWCLGMEDVRLCERWLLVWGGTRRHCMVVLQLYYLTWIRYGSTYLILLQYFLFLKCYNLLSFEWKIKKGPCVYADHRAWYTMHVISV